VGASRTPIGNFNGSLSTLTAPELGVHAVQGVLSKYNIPKESIQEVYFGNVLQANVGQAPATQVVIKSGLSNSIIGTTINKVCASGAKTIMLGASSIMLGQNDVVLTGGMESMSNAPYYLPKARNGYRYGHGEVVDSIVKDGLFDVYENFLMGMCAEDCSTKFGITRDEQDKFSIDSYNKAIKAWKDGKFNNEVVKVTIKSNKGDTVVSEDEEYKNLKLDKVSTLKPAFKKDGTVTAFNSSKINDGAAALVLMSGQKAKELGLKPLARILSFADAQQAPIEFTTTPSIAIPKALKLAGLSIDQIDLFEINEAFAVVGIANNRLLKLDPSKVNVNGGAVALGHPIGASGARIAVTLIHALQTYGKKYGVLGICNGGGGASAIVFEKI